MRHALASLLSEPRPADPPGVMRRDYVLLAAFIACLIIEATLRDDIQLTPWSPIILASTMSTMLWRRTRPWPMVAIAFFVISAIDVVSWDRSGSPVVIYSAAFVLVLLYSLGRWGSGQDMAMGLAVALIKHAIDMSINFTGIGDLIGGIIVLEFAILCGVAVRYWGAMGHQRAQEIRFQERELLARELHDSVAHHVSAIAVQAQAGQFLAGQSSLDGAADALATIEEEASRTLEEMRSIVHTLRDPREPSDVAPQRGVGEIADLANHFTTRGTQQPGVAAPSAPELTTEIDSSVGTLSPAVDAALFRIAQESITNAVRHAENATSVAVHVEGDATSVRMIVTDDGDSSNRPTTRDGFGLIGMDERATLVGGSFEAGPTAQGWRVEAVLPRDSDR